MRRAQLQLVICTVLKSQGGSQMRVCLPATHATRLSCVLEPMEADAAKICPLLLDRLLPAMLRTSRRVAMVHTRPADLRLQHTVL